MKERLNLIPASHLLSRRRARRVQAWLIGCSTYALAAVVAVLAMQVALAREPEDLHLGLMDVSHMREKMQLQLDHLTKERTLLTQQYAAARAVGVQPDWSIPLCLLGAEGARGIVLMRLEMSPVVEGEGRSKALWAEPARYQIRMEGLAVSEGALADLIRSIERAGPFTRVVREATSTEEFRKTKDAVRFRLVCEIGAGAKAGAGGNR